MSLICGNRILFNSKVPGILFSTSCYSTTAREARFLKKLMVGTSKSKRKWFNVDQTPAKAFKDFNFLSQKSVISAEKKQKPGKVVRRVQVLNTVFMEQITSLLATGDAGVEILGLGLEISGVEMSSNFGNLSVYWYSSGGEEKEEYLATILEQAAHSLRHQLSQLRVIGYVPPIKFIKDDEYFKLGEVQRLMQIADYGNDFTPTDIGRKMKAPLPVLPSSTLPPELRKKIEEFEFLTSDVDSDSEECTQTSFNESDSSEDELAADNDLMRHDILGLNREAMMRKITDGMARIRLKNNPIQAVDSGTIQQAMYFTREDAMDHIKQEKLRTSEFLSFLKTRRIEKAKELKRQAAEMKEREFYESERSERMMLNIESPEPSVDFPQDLEDYLDEEERLEDE